MPHPRIDGVPVSNGVWRAAWSIYGHLTSVRRRHLLGTVLLMVAGAFAEIATIGAVLPFIVIVTPGAHQARYDRVVAGIARMGWTIGIGTITMSAILLIFITIVSVAIRLKLVRASQNFAVAVTHDLALQIYERTLHQHYNYHIMRNSSETLSGLEKVQYVLGDVMLPAMLGTTAAVVAVSILSALIAADPMTSLVACACVVGIYAVVTILMRRPLDRNSGIIAGALRERLQTLQEGLGGIRDVLLDQSQPIFLAAFARIDRRLRESQSANLFIGAAPRFFVEGGGVVLIALFTVYVAGRPGGVIAALPMLGALALGAQRLLPLTQQMYYSASQIYGSRNVLDDVVQLLNLPMRVVQSGTPLPELVREIRFDRVSFTYPASDRPALRDISLTIPKGSRIGLIGKSGSGKSTLVDLLLGLLDPNVGQVAIDGRALDEAVKSSWQAQIAHVPQAIFLSDGTIASNIAFGRNADEIDRDLIRTAALDADLADFIASLPAKYDTLVGERGVRLSGGQRQRIGIARALYKRANVLVFDEATSALDDETEASVMEAINALPRHLTLISIAHRVSTLRTCDTIVRLSEGEIVASGSYAAIVGDGLSVEAGS